MQERIADGLKDALRSGDKTRLGVLRMVLSELEVARASGKEVDEVAVVKAYAGKLRKSAEQYRRLNLPDQAGALLAELDVVEQFLPRQMGRDEVEALVVELIEKNDYGPRDLGRLMKTVMSMHGDLVEGRLVQQIARERLSDGG